MRWTTRAMLSVRTAVESDTVEQFWNYTKHFASAQLHQIFCTTLLDCYLQSFSKNMKAMPGWKQIRRTSYFRKN